MRQIITVTIFFLICSSEFSAAKEVRYLVRSPKSLLMGDASTSLVDDDYILFYNPAAIGKSLGVYLNPLNPDIGITNALDDQERFKDLPKDAAGIADRVLGYPLYIHGGATPSLRFGPFMFSMFASNSTSVILRNAVHPFIDIDYRYDRGFVMGFAYTFGGRGKKDHKTKRKTAPAGSRTSIGISAKNFTREGIRDSFSLFSTTLLNKIDETDADLGALKKALGYSKGSGWGGDVGVEHAITKGSTELAFAFSVLDIGDTRISTYDGTKKLPNQDMYMNTGISFKQDLTIIDYSFSLDIHPINEPIDFKRKIHVGFQLGLPLVRGYAGFNQGYVSYGVAFRFWPIEIVAGFYSVELGTSYRQQEGKRALLYLNLLDFAFDIK